MFHRFCPAPSALGTQPGSPARLGRKRPADTGRAAALGLALALSGCAAAPPDATLLQLEGRRWELAQITSMDDAQAPLKPPDPRRYWIELGSGGQLQLGLDCNQGRASWQSQPAPDSKPQRRSGSLTLGPIASTRAACPPGSLAPRLSALLPHVRSYVIERGQLHLALMADGGILSWNPAPPAAP